ncbi:LptF/LptG family permease [Shimia sp. Alg240-R146]|uniref:LptF/LptG family permease n=1 Tax=Shimia sp. Alg240-R146 TaxID=2993449 RepID=UPI0022E5A1AC|nr:LptF/LptG family permease [Shimia sp. Alg240-R146]
MSLHQTFLRQPVLRIIGWPILWRLLLILAVIEAIFLAEEFTGLLQLALRLDGPASVIGQMLIFRMPAIFDLALAFGLLIAVYFAVGEARDNGELVVLATAGIPWWRVVTLVLGIGLAGGLLSLLNAGYILPMAKFSERVTVAELRKDYVLNRIQTPDHKTALQTIEDTTFVSTPPNDGDPNRNGNLFVFQPDVNGFWRAATSRNWQINAVDSDRHVIALQNLAVHDVPLVPPSTPAFMNRYEVSAADFTFDMSKVIPDVDRERSAAERFLMVSQDQTRRITNIATRALMVPLAGLLALAALVAARNTLTRLLALPLSGVLMLSIDVASRATVVGWINALPEQAIALLSVLLYLAPPLLFLAFKKEALMKPAARDL